MAEDGVAEDDAAEAGEPAQSAGDVAGVHGAAPIAVAGERTDAVATAGNAGLLGLTASAAGHLLIALAIFVSLAPFPVTPDAIPVKLVPAEQAPPKPREKPPEKQAQQKPPQQKQAEQKPPQEKQAPPEKAPPDQKAPEQKAPEQKAQEQNPPEQKATGQKAPAEAPAADPAKAGSAGNQPPAPAKDSEKPKKTPTPWSDIAASLGMADYGRKTPLAESLLAEIGDAVKRCWKVPDGWSDPHQVSVALRFQLNPDGSLDGDPAVVEFRATPIGAAAAKAAIDAVKQCGPYRLPRDKYDQWQDVQLKLAP